MASSPSSSSDNALPNDDTFSEEQRQYLLQRINHHTSSHAPDADLAEIHTSVISDYQQHQGTIITSKQLRQLIRTAQRRAATHTHRQNQKHSRRAQSDKRQREHEETVSRAKTRSQQKNMQETLSAPKPYIPAGNRSLSLTTQLSVEVAQAMNRISPRRPKKTKPAEEENFSSDEKQSSISSTSSIDTASTVSLSHSVSSVVDSNSALSEPPATSVVPPIINNSGPAPSTAIDSSSAASVSSSSSQVITQQQLVVTIPPAASAASTAAVLTTMTKKEKKASNKETRKMIGEKSVALTQAKEKLEAEKLLMYQNINKLLPKQEQLIEEQRRYLQWKYESEKAAAERKENKENIIPNVR